MDKTALRRILRERRQAFVCEQESVGIFLPPDVQDRLMQSRCLAGYVSNGREPDVLPWLQVLAKSGVATALPWIGARDAPMTFRAWSPGDPLETAPFGFQQPSYAAPELTPDVILTPLVAFDSAGNRLGQGAGHYDRAFARFPEAFRVGVAWSVQKVERLATDLWDVPMHLVVTENDVITPTPLPAASH